MVQGFQNIILKEGTSIQLREKSVNNFFSSSLVRSDKQSLYQDNQMFRLVYQGSLQTKKTTLDKLEPVTVVLTNPNTLVTKGKSESKLDVL